ncbi:MAG: hypothetical protein QXF41_03475 [Candidatus Micrarchaeaceae archaeon]
MPKYYKAYSASHDETLYLTVDDSGAVIIRDEAGHKVFLSRYQAKLMKFGIKGLLKDLFGSDDSSDVKIEELKEPAFK